MDQFDIFNKIDAVCMEVLSGVQTGGARNNSKIKIISEKRKLYLKKVQ